MGICCPAQDMGPTTLQDLPEPSLEGVDDMYKRFELTTVFARTPFGPFEEAVQKAAGDNDWVSFDDLATELNTTLWKKVTDGSSALRKLLEQPAFQGENSDLDLGRIDKNKLIMFGLLNCVDSKKPMAKAKGLYCILQDGGFEKHDQIAASDKDYVPTFTDIVNLAGKDLFAAAKVVDDVDQVFDESDVEAMDGVIQELSDDLLDDVYGNNSRLSNDDWLKAITTVGAWIFNPTEIRKRLVEKAELDQKHMN